MRNDMLSTAADNENAEQLSPVTMRGVPRREVPLTFYVGSEGSGRFYKRPAVLLAAGGTITFVITYQVSIN